MFARIFSGGLTGIDAYCIEVEVDCTGGIGQIQIVGLPDAAVKESQERVRSAIKACSFLMPPGKKWVVNLAPADTRKEGPSFDLPIAVGILAATGLLPTASLSQYWLVGELGLDGSLRPVTGILPIAIASKAFRMPTRRKPVWLRGLPFILFRTYNRFAKSSEIQNTLTI
jgi:magnesium chelatase family protein